MNFLWPIAWAFAALAIPVVAFYLIRTRLEQKPVSTLLFWRDLTPQVYNSSLWRRLRRWISLALQLLFLLLLVFALTQPFTSFQSAKPVSLIIVLDASPSMGARATNALPSRWEEARLVAERRIAQMRFFDEAVVILAADAPRVLSGWSRSKRGLQRALATASISGPTGDVVGALALARDLASQRAEAEIVLVSDGVLAEAPAAEAIKDVKAHWIGGEARNVGLTLFNARRSLSVPGEIQLLARVVASHDTTASLEIRRDGRLIDVRPLTLEAGKPWQRTWDYTGEGAARFEARLTGMERDDLAADNRAESALSALRRIPVELVSPPNAFLEAALDSLTSVTTQRTWPVDQLAGQQADPSKLYIFHDALPPEGFQPTSMLLINPGGDGLWGKINGDLETALISDSDADDPLLRFVSIERLLLRKARDMTPAPGAKVYAESFGKPLLFGQWVNEPRWLVLPFGFEESDLVFRTSFPILLGNLVQSLQAEEARAATPLPGEAESLMKRHSMVENAVVVAPGGRNLAWWTGWPLWWWAVAAGVLWLCWEWWMYSRRITE